MRRALCSGRKSTAHILAVKAVRPNSVNLYFDLRHDNFMAGNPLNQRGVEFYFFLASNNYAYFQFQGRDLLEDAFSPHRKITAVRILSIRSC